jgi:hypothetical protein
LYTKTIDTNKILNSVVFKEQYAKKVFGIDDINWNTLSEKEKTDIRTMGQNLLNIAIETGRNLDKEVP